MGGLRDQNHATAITNAAKALNQAIADALADRLRADVECIESQSISGETRTAIHTKVYKPID